MTAQAAAAVMWRPRAPYVSSRADIKLAPSFRWRVIALGAIRYHNAGIALKLAASVFASAAAAFVIMACQEGNQDTAATEPVRNETIVFRQKEQIYAQTEQVNASDHDEVEAAAIPSNYARLVKTIRFVNPGAPQNLGIKGKLHPLSGTTYVPADKFTYRAEGIASWYGPDFHGRPTSNGERYDMNGISAAHRTMPLPSYARVTNLDNGRSIIVRVNNRGPFVHNRVIDLSIGTAKALDSYRKGTARVRVEFVGRAPIEGSDDQMLLATLRVGTPAPALSQLMAAATNLSPKVTDGKDRRTTEH
jgi:rare lipoprotein A (peptidoglycan hydrolase)